MKFVPLVKISVNEKLVSIALLDGTILFISFGAHKLLLNDNSSSTGNLNSTVGNSFQSSTNKSPLSSSYSYFIIGKNIKDYLYSEEDCKEFNKHISCCQSSTMITAKTGSFLWMETQIIPLTNKIRDAIAYSAYQNIKNERNSQEGHVNFKDYCLYSNSNDNNYSYFLKDYDFSRLKMLSYRDFVLQRKDNSFSIFLTSTSFQTEHYRNDSICSDNDNVASNNEKYYESHKYSNQNNHHDELDETTVHHYSSVETNLTDNDNVDESESESESEENSQSKISALNYQLDESYFDYGKETVECDPESVKIEDYHYPRGYFNQLEKKSPFTHRDTHKTNSKRSRKILSNDVNSRGNKDSYESSTTGGTLEEDDYTIGELFPNSIVRNRYSNSSSYSSSNTLSSSNETEEPYPIDKSGRSKKQHNKKEFINNQESLSMGNWWKYLQNKMNYNKLNTSVDRKKSHHSPHRRWSDFSGNTGKVPCENSSCSKKHCTSGTTASNSRNATNYRIPPNSCKPINAYSTGDDEILIKKSKIEDKNQIFRQRSISDLTNHNLNDEWGWFVS